MKKFRVEVDGEEFIVNVEEIGAEETVKRAEPTPTNKKESNSVSRSQKSQNVTPAPQKKTQQEMAAPADVGEGDVLAPMPGSILEVDVKKGDSVNKGDLLIVLEAMKMENEITAVKAGTVKEINVRVGDSVDAEDKLLVIE